MASTASRSKYVLWSAAIGIVAPVLVGLPPAWYPKVLHAFSIGPLHFNSETVLIAAWPTSALMEPLLAENPSAPPGHERALPLPWWGGIALFAAIFLLNPVIYAAAGVIWRDARCRRATMAVFVACVLSWLIFVFTGRFEAWWGTVVARIIG